MVRKLVIAALLLRSGFAAGVVQQSVNSLPPNAIGADAYVMSFNWTGDASTGSVPTTAAKIGQFGMQGYLVTHVETAPGTPNPTAGYSVTLTDFSGVDILGGAAAGLSGTIPQMSIAPPTSPPLAGTFNLVIAGNSVASAKGLVLVYLRRVSSTQLVQSPVPILISAFAAQGIATMNAVAAPGTPAAGSFYLYMDAADNKLKSKGPSGTVTVLAVP